MKIETNFDMDTDLQLGKKYTAEISAMNLKPILGIEKADAMNLKPILEIEKADTINIAMDSNMLSEIDSDMDCYTEDLNMTIVHPH